MAHALAVAAVSASLGVSLPATAANFSQMVFFGDSLTDSGYFRGIGQQASFTTNPDPVWAQILASGYGLHANPAAVLTPTGVQAAGGTDYAVGGARVSNQNGFPSPAIAGFIPTVSNQVNGYLAANPKLDSKALYSVWAGANDILGYTQANIAGLMNPATQAATAQQTVLQVVGEAANVVGLVKRLQQAGAGTVMVVNLPDVGHTPQAAATGLGTLWTAASSNFNLALNAGLNSLGGNIVALNAFGLLNEVIANPTPYGFTNVTTPACTSRDAGNNLTSSLCTRATLVAPNAYQTYLFADGVHPTGAGHAILAQYVRSVLQAPGQIGLLAEAPLSGAQALTRVVDNRFRSSPQAGKAEAYAVLNNTELKFDHGNNNPGLDGSTNSVAIGVDYAMNQNWLVGGAFGYGHNKTDFGGNTGGFKMNQAMISAYTQYRNGAWAINGVALAGSLAFDDVKRNITLGQTIRTEQGDSNGHQLLFRVGGQYDFNLGAITAGPVASLAWQKVNVDAYTEQDSNSTTMHFDQQTRKSLISSLGVQMTTSLPVGKYTVQPFAKLAWEKEYENDERDVRAHVLDMAGSFGLPAYRAPDNSARLDLGANIALATDFSAYAGYSGQFGGSNKSHSFQVGLKKAF
ncbi:autotransporter outer membrane beta-barrel domain-containing protein [Paraherbaspirillum soli]|uniref:Autotransporter outer membrane beta-barrel domain-containing protein n=1 Tax=Paraherbaspirillum soli TaxID=631222 RepID=A0ABW0MB40_9BURK